MGGICNLAMVSATSGAQGAYLSASDWYWGDGGNDGQRMQVCLGGGASQVRLLPCRMLRKDGVRSGLQGINNKAKK